MENYSYVGLAHARPNYMGNGKWRWCHYTDVIPFIPIGAMKTQAASVGATPSPRPVSCRSYEDPSPHFV